MEEGRPSLGPIFSGYLRAARGLSAAPTPLDAEIYAGGILSTWQRAHLVGVDDPELFFAERYVGFLSENRGKEALAVLHAVAAVAPDPVSSQARFAARRLRTAGRPEPAWADRLAHRRFLGAWASTDQYGDQTLLCATFEHAGYPPHAVVLILDHNFHGLIRRAELTEEPDGVREDWEARSGMTIQDIDAQATADLLANGMELFGSYIDPPCDEGVEQLASLLDARLRLLPPAREIEIPEVPAARRRSVVAAFRRSPEAKGLQDPWLAEYFVDYACDYGAGDPLRWSPIAIELCLVDWFPRKISLEADQAAQLPEVLRRWVRFAAKRKGLGQELIDESLAAVDRFAPEYLKAMGDPSRFGPAKSMVQEMLDDGVDLTDQKAVQAWVDARNAEIPDPAGGRVR